MSYGNIRVEHIHRALIPHFIWQKNPESPLLVVKDENTNSIGMAVTIFIGLSLLFGISKEDTMMYLDIDHKEYRTKLKRFKEHIYSGLIRRGQPHIIRERNNDDKYLMKYEMCRRYIELHYKTPSVIELWEIF